MPRRSECDIDSMHELLQEPVQDPSAKPKRSGLADLADALSKIAAALERLPDNEARCRVMAQVCLSFESYDEAERFIELARQHKARASRG